LPRAPPPPTCCTTPRRRDYAANPEQDRYESENIDDDVEEEDYEQAEAFRRAADEAMDARAEVMGGRKRLPIALRGAPPLQLAPARPGPGASCPAPLAAGGAWLLGSGRSTPAADVHPGA
jgi:hypothetical protein